MKTDTNISLILPLADARRSARTGDKAIKLSRLIASRFDVPRGFVINADAYRSHLWASGARDAASAGAEAEDREKVRNAIISHAIPEDVRQEIARAYERLSWQCGMQEPKVAVRASSLEAGAQGVLFSGAYENYLNVSGLEQLEIAVKRVWASLWTGTAAAYRTRLKSPVEPAMAVIVQQMIPAQWVGTTAAADEATGNPLKVIVSCQSIQKALAPEESWRYELDLSDFALASRREVPGPAPDQDVLKVSAEKALVAQDVLGGPVELEWAYDGRSLWILQARLMEQLTPYFPFADQIGEHASRTLRRLTPEPISHLARSLLWDNEKQNRREPSRTVLLNGRVYAQGLPQRRPRGRIAGWRENRKTLHRGEAYLQNWAHKAKRRLETDCENCRPSGISDMNHPDLLKILDHAAKTARRSWEWVERADHWADHWSAVFRGMLREMLADEPDGERLFHRLLGGLADPNLMRDAKLQDLGDRLAAQRARVEVPGNDWWREFQMEVTALATEYAYSFLTNAQLCDIASWKSWTEDPDPLYRAAAALARRGDGQTFVTLHAASQRDAEQAADEARALFGAAGRRRFETFRKLARGWLEASAEAEHTYARACAALRHILAELGRRLAACAAISDPADIFHLKLEELHALPEKPDEDQQRSLVETISRRKQEVWLESRLAAPRTIAPEDSEPLAESADQDEAAADTAVLIDQANPAHRRVARTPAEAAELKDGETLVVRTAKPGWTPFLALASAIMADEKAFGAAARGDYGRPVFEDCAGVLDGFSDERKSRVDRTQETASPQVPTRPR